MYAASKRIGVNNPMSNAHLSAERMQALLEGELPSRDAASIEEHLAGCARCSAEMDGWRVLFEGLGELASPGPHEGFADRVMAQVAVGPTESLVHVSAEVIQDFLEGTLAARQATRVERHLEACSTCTGEADAWLGVLHQLKSLEVFSPAATFADRVLAGIELPAAVPLAARLRARVAGLLGVSDAAHVPASLLQDFVDGALPARAVARVQTHIDSCGACASDVADWRTVVARIESVERFAPQPDFADQVMERVRLHQLAPAVRPAPVWARAAAAALRLVPQTRQAWAALSGVAVTPAAIFGLLFYAVFSHPTLTLGSLASFAWWQVTDLASAFAARFAATALQSGEVFGLYSLVETLASAPLMVAGGVFAYSMVCGLALRVLYRNLLANRPLNGRYTHVTAS